MDGSEIAIIGMAGRFPGARSIDEYWANIRGAVESITRFSDEDLLKAGVPAAALQSPAYVKARPALDGVEFFDAEFFGFSPREAEVMDPQQRFFLECVWEALEHSGHIPETDPAVISVYAGVSTSTYLTANLYANPEAVQQIGYFQAFLSNVQDSLATRAAYKLNLTGGCYSVQTFCSTSLVSVHMACQALADLECDMAVAGGVSINVPQNVGYWYQEGGIHSPDGHCRAFDEKAGGTLFGNGVGVVVLKRLDDALADGDTIHAVIKGSATNNDGSLKVSYTAPSVTGQARVIVEAMANAGVEPETVSYVEAHGTGTQLGDPTEISALTKAFRSGTQKKGFCAIGSVKTNIGHLDAAAGVASLIKAVMALQNRQFPPTLHYEKPNPEIDFPNSPFYVSSRLADWPAGPTPRRAGVSSFGIGGTNAHVILQEAPELPRVLAPRTAEMLVISARSATALDAATHRLAAHLKLHPHLPLQDVAYTLQVGRKAFSHRRVLVATGVDDALQALESLDPKRVFTQYQEQRNPSVVFLFPGQGAQYVDMGRGLYAAEPVFRQQVDACVELLRPHLGFDLRQVLFPEAGNSTEAAARLSQTSITQPALFVIEFALAKLWMSWGVTPKAMIGHSIGEYVAACLAGVFSLADALMLVARRAALMQALPAGSMVAVPLPAAELEALIQSELQGSILSVAASNGPAFSVVSGEAESVGRLTQLLGAKGLECRPLHTSHAFHSQMMEPMLAEFTALVGKVQRQAPSIPYLSNLTGTWIQPSEATDPTYWARHLRGTVRFSDGIRELAKEPNRLLLEVGPGQTLCSLVRQHREEKLNALQSLRHPQDASGMSDSAFLLTGLARAWQSGLELDWRRLHGKTSPRRIPLPTYPFERQRFWIEPAKRSATRQKRGSQRREIADWFYTSAWKSSTPLGSRTTTAEPQRWLILHGEGDVGPAVAEALAAAGHRVATALASDAWGDLGDRRYRVNPSQPEHYPQLLQGLATGGFVPNRVLHLWAIAPVPPELTLSDIGNAGMAEVWNRGLYSLAYLARALSRHAGSEPVELVVGSTGVQDVTGEEALSPLRSTLLAACKVIPQEMHSLRVRNLDLDPVPNATVPADWMRRFLNELCADGVAPEVAWRGRYRWTQSFESLPVPAREGSAVNFRERGVYWITGGLGGVSLVFAEHLARTYRARLVLSGRSALPPRDGWDVWLSAHDSRDGTSRKILQVRALETLGAEVLPVAADVGDAAQMRSALEQAKARFGVLHGVIHAAGVLEKDTFLPVEELTPAIFQRQFQPKVQGLLVLDEVLRCEPLDFCLLTSSLSSVLGGLNYCAYAAANQFMDGFARLRSRGSSVRWVSVNWDEWQLAEEVAAGEAGVSSVARGAIRRKEGGEALESILRSPRVPQIVVSTSDLQLRIDQWIKLEAVHRSSAITESAAAKSLHARPNIATAFVAPENETEKTIAEIWQQLLGIQQVGLHDNFFELGGHSLLATQLISRLRKAFGVELPLRTMFEATTIAELAKRIQTLQWLTTNQKAGASESTGEREEIEL